MYVLPFKRGTRVDIDGTFLFIRLAALQPAEHAAALYCPGALEDSATGTDNGPENSMPLDNSTFSALSHASSTELWIPPLVGAFTDRMPEAFDRSGGSNFYTRILFSQEQPHNC